MKKLTKSTEAKFFQTSILIYWTFFWLLNVVDKFVTEPVTFWHGKNRYVQFSDYLYSIGIENEFLVWSLIGIVTVIEAVALIFVLSALTSFAKNNWNKARDYFFMATVTSLFIFTLFSIGDQVFGDRTELWEHGTFFMLTLVSWFGYKHYAQKE